MNLQDVDLKRFHSKYDIGKEADCWEWKFSRASCRNPRAHFAFGGRSYSAARIMWQIMFGDCGDLYVCHKCDNPKCVNPSHLFLGTARDNMRDMFAKGRGYKQKHKGEAILTKAFRESYMKRHRINQLER